MKIIKINNFIKRYIINPLRNLKINWTVQFTFIIVTGLVPQINSFGPYPPIPQELLEKEIVLLLNELFKVISQYAHNWDDPRRSILSKIFVNEDLDAIVITLIEKINILRVKLLTYNSKDFIIPWPSGKICGTDLNFYGEYTYNIKKSIHLCMQELISSGKYKIEFRNDFLNIKDLDTMAPLRTTDLVYGHYIGHGFYIRGDSVLFKPLNETSTPVFRDFSKFYQYRLEIYNRDLFYGIKHPKTFIGASGGIGFGMGILDGALGGNTCYTKCFKELEEWAMTYSSPIEMKKLDKNGNTWRFLAKSLANHWDLGKGYRDSTCTCVYFGAGVIIAGIAVIGYFCVDGAN